MTAAQWGQAFVIAIIVSAFVSPLIGNHLRKRRAGEEFRGLLEQERKARIRTWLSAEEEKYMATIKHDFSIADAITRDDQEAFSNDYQDQQPTRPSAA